MKITLNMINQYLKDQKISQDWKIINNANEINSILTNEYQLDLEKIEVSELYILRELLNQTSDLEETWSCIINEDELSEIINLRHDPKVYDLLLQVQKEMKENLLKDKTIINEYFIDYPNLFSCVNYDSSNDLLILELRNYLTRNHTYSELNKLVAWYEPILKENITNKKYINHIINLIEIKNHPEQFKDCIILIKDNMTKTIDYSQILNYYHNSQVIK